MKRNLILGLIPLLCLAALVVLLFNRLENPLVKGHIDSPLIGKPAPALEIRDAVLINFFASWCGPCAIEHPFLMNAKKSGVKIIGIAYKDTPKDIDAYLKRMGNPYTQIIMDRAGNIGLEYGITGVPETWRMDERKILRNRFQGPFGTQSMFDDFMKGKP